MKKTFLTGLATLLPLAVTLYIVIFFVDLLTHPFVGIVTRLLSKIPLHLPFLSEALIHTASQILIILALFGATLLLGLVARSFFFDAFIKLGDRALHKIPIVRSVYKTVKDIVQTLFSSDKNSFKQVVLVPFPYKGSYCLGLVTREAPDTCQNTPSDEMVSVYLPTTPNPMTGYLIMSPRSELIELNMKSDEAIKYIVSCGGIRPEMKESGT
jgi:uncharacterized membrane protein